MKKLYIFVLLLAISISALGCTKKENSQTDIKNNNQIEETETSENKTTEDSLNKNYDDKLAENEDSQSQNSKNKSDYSKYSGNWVNEDLLIDDYKYGTSVKLNVDKNRTVTGTIFSSTENLTHISKLEISGHIDNNKLSYEFDDDGWEHGGIVDIDFKENSIVLNIKYTKGNNDSTLWGIGEGSFALIKDTTPVKRTINNLKGGGLSIIENQTFDTTFENYGNVKFISGSKREDASDIPVFYIADKSENILYKLPAFHGNDTVRLKEITCVAFMDLNGDKLKDILVIGIFTDGIKESNIANIYFQNGKEFKNDTALDEKINNSGRNKNMESVVDFVKNL